MGCSLPEALDPQSCRRQRLDWPCISQVWLHHSPPRCRWCAECLLALYQSHRLSLCGEQPPLHGQLCGRKTGNMMKHVLLAVAWFPPLGAVQNMRNGKMCCMSAVRLPPPVGLGVGKSSEGHFFRQLFSQVPKQMIRFLILISFHPFGPLGFESRVWKHLYKKR